MARVSFEDLYDEDDLYLEDDVGTVLEDLSMCEVLLIEYEEHFDKIFNEVHNLWNVCKNTKDVPEDVLNLVERLVEITEYVENKI